MCDNIALFRILCLEFAEILGKQRLRTGLFFLNRGKFSGPEEKSDAAATCKNHQKSTLYPFSRSSGALGINATTLYFWILIADIQSYSGFVSSVLSESNLLTSVVFVIVYFMLVYGM